MRCFVLFITTSLFLYSNLAKAQTEEVSHTLDSVTIVGRKYTSHIRQHGGSYVIDMTLMDVMPKILGNADPIHFLQTIPGVQTTNDYDAGIHIQGCDNGHNILSIDGIPVYNTGHLLGLFSTFNPGHFRKVATTFSPYSSSSANRLGGSISVSTTDSIATTIHGELAVGPMSSQGSITLPLTSQSSVVISARLSYLNLLYSPWLKIDDSRFTYSFYDINATYLLAPSDRDTLSVSFYSGQDEIGATDPYLQAQLHVKWGNTLLGASWRHRFAEDFLLKQSLYATHYENGVNIRQGALSLNVPSQISTYGCSTRIDFHRLTFGCEALHHDIEPQAPLLKSHYQHLASYAKQRAQEASAYLSAVARHEPWYAEFGLRGSLFHHQGQSTYVGLDPSFSFTWAPTTSSSVTICLYSRHQYLFLTGISSIGLPVEFWCAASPSMRPQRVEGISLKYEKSSHKGYKIYTELFYKSLHGQIEYTGDLLDFFSNTYSLDKYTARGKGENFGLNIIVSKNTGRFTGWIGYAYTHARRTINDDYFKGTFPSSHERPHELTSVASYRLGRRWEFGGTFTFASGTAYTASALLYQNNGMILSSYGEYNRNRLPAYSRLDVSANYTFLKNNRSEFGINLSIYNLLNHKNYQTYRVHTGHDKIVYHGISAVVGILPSVNLYYHF